MTESSPVAPDRDVAEREAMEVWKPVPEWESLYEVSSLGRVRSLVRYAVANSGLRPYGGRVLKQIKCEYPMVHLSDKKRVRVIQVHKLVALAFLGPCPSDKHLVAHGDGDGFNNRVENLRWATQAENEADKLRHGRVRLGENSPRAKLTNEKVLEIRSSPLNSVQLGRKFGVNKSTIRRIRLGQIWGHLSAR